MGLPHAYSDSDPSQMRVYNRDCHYNGIDISFWFRQKENSIDRLQDGVKQPEQRGEVESGRQDGARHRRKQGNRARDRGGARGVRGAGAHLRPQRRRPAGVPSPVARRRPPRARHGVRLRRLRARRQGAPRGRGARGVRRQSGHPRQQRRADLLQGGHGEHGGGLRPPHGHQPRVLLPPRPARAPAPPRGRGGGGGRQQRGEHLLHRRVRLLSCAVGVLGDQGRHEPAHPEPRRRVGARQRARQLRRAGKRPDRHHRQQPHNDGPGGGAGGDGGGAGAGPHAPHRRTRGDLLHGRLSLHAGRVLHHRAGHLRRRRPHHSRLGLAS